MMLFISRYKKCNLRKKGFTLIELLLGLGIFSIIAVCIYSTFAGGIQLNHRSEKKNDVYREIRWSFDLMSEEIENMLFFNFASSYPETIAFEGKEDEVRFLSGDNNGLKVITYRLMQPEDAGTIHKIIVGETFSKNETVVTDFEESFDKVYYLAREEVPFIDYLQENKEDNAQVEILCSNVKENGLRFFYGYSENVEGEREDENSNYTWENEWTLNYNPSHVRIELDVPSPERDKEILTLSRNIFIPTGNLGINQIDTGE